MKTETECERVLAYMSERYQDSFTCPVYYGGYPGTPVHQYYLNAEKLGDAAVKVEVLRSGTPREKYLDNYMGLVFEPQLKEEMTELLAENFCVAEEDIYLMMDPSALGLSDHWTPETTYEEYCADPSAGIYFRAVIRTEQDMNAPMERHVTEECLEMDLKEAGICCTGWLFFVPADADLDGLSQETFYERIALDHNYDARLFFNMRTVDKVDTFAWEKAAEPAVTAADSDD